MNNTFSISGQIVDLIASRIFSGTVTVENGKITAIEERATAPNQYILPGFIDSHIHIESSMLVPSEFARIATLHGTVATVSDPHEIANVLGKEGVKFMIENGKSVPFKFFFGAPSCVPATSFETSGAVLKADDIQSLMQSDDIYFLGEMMNFPGVIYDDKETLDKLCAAQKTGKPIDGHAPGLSGTDLKKYVNAAISTDHECFTIEEAQEKMRLGMKILIRDGSAARNFDDLIALLETQPENLMFCSDDKHPNELIQGHINVLVKRAVAMGYKVMDVLKAASLNVAKHYHLNVGMLQQGDDADFIVVDNLTEFNIKKTYIKGVLVAQEGHPLIERVAFELPNHFIEHLVSNEDFFVEDKGKAVKAIGCIDGQLITETAIVHPKSENGNLVSDTEQDLLKIAVVNRYKECKPALGFIKNFGLKQGAIASSIAHDSHNIVAVGVSDEDLAQAVNKIIEAKGGIAAYSKQQSMVLAMPVAGLMSADDAQTVASGYEQIDLMAKSFGTKLHAPFMTLAFMSLLVIPSLKISDKGLFDVDKFRFTDLYVD